MTIKSIDALRDEADVVLADNTTQAITAADLRNLILDMLDTVQPAHSMIALNSLPIALNAAPQALAPFNSVVLDTPGFYTADLPNGTIEHTAGAPVIEDVVTASGNVSGPNGSDISLILFHNGSATPFSVAVSTAGPGNVIGFTLSGLLRTTGNAVFEVRAFGAAGNYTFTNVKLSASRQPVRSFV
ncbi:MAG TPA: hypothetical protein VJR90_01100 [Gammaproteobacteria bacterium]|nr:hypothetical protein [Gammaproteobacteria bacterium]